MNIPQRQIEGLTAFGYTVSEARFLYIVAMHSGYFTARQFLAFVDAKRGYRTRSLAQKLITQGHATIREYRRNGCIYHLYSRSSMPSLATRTFATAAGIGWKRSGHGFSHSISSSPTRGISTSKRKRKRSPISATNCTSKRAAFR